MALEKKSPCKVNLLLNILGKRADGFHELETVMHPAPLYDRLVFEKGSEGVQLTCSDSSLPVDSRNLVWRAAENFLRAAQISDGVQIYLEKKIPVAAGLGGGSGNAATTLLGLNELFANPLSSAQMNEIAAALGSDIPFFMQNKPALGIGRGEQVRSLDFFPALNGVYILLVHPGFGISTAWAYQELKKFPSALNGERGRAEKLIKLLQTTDFKTASGEFYNSLEAPALKKYPLLYLFQEFFREQGAVTLMSGSGSTTFALIEGKFEATEVLQRFISKFGDKFWTALLPLVS
ncbi:MAG: 4-(cytidine 5'-diphospho)-2-C-methyl-D-erythritol kinase [Verrucomicrobia bacterium]|nr:4-(cytidine 5'-diphospho)-2-C-methyl-D-erythritol kinase [Verrucomicrobiota bacterium]